MVVLVLWNSEASKLLVSGSPLTLTKTKTEGGFSLGRGESLGTNSRLLVLGLA